VRQPVDLSAVSSVLGKTECSRGAEEQKDQFPMEILGLDD